MENEKFDVYNCILDDWQHTNVNPTTGERVPLKITCIIKGEYRCEIKNEKKFREKMISINDIINNEIMEYMKRINQLRLSFTELIVSMRTLNSDFIISFNENVLESFGVECTYFAITSFDLDEKSRQDIRDYEMRTNAFLRMGRMDNN